VDYRLTGLFPPFVLGWSVIAVKPSGSWGGWLGGTAAGLLMNYVDIVAKKTFFYVIQKFKKIRKTFLQER
jgi:fructose-specific phosphotransferase system IIC component